METPAHAHEHAEDYDREKGVWLVCVRQHGFERIDTTLEAGSAPVSAPIFALGFSFGRMRTYTTKGEMDARVVATPEQMIESHAYRELAAAQMFGYGLQFVPELKWLRFMARHVREEVEHLRDRRPHVPGVTGTSAEPRILGRLAQKPIPFAQTWLELGMAQFLYDRGGLWQLCEYEECAFLPYRQAVQKIIKEESGHQAPRRTHRDRFVCKASMKDGKQRYFEKWLRQGLLSFGRPRPEGNEYAIAAGLKKRDSGEVMQDFLDDIKPAVKACGLLFQRPEEMGVEVPASLDWRSRSGSVAGGNFSPRPWCLRRPGVARSIERQSTDDQLTS